MARGKQKARAKPRQRSGGRIKLVISYRRSDSSGISDRLYDRLVTEYGTANVNKDIYSIPPGEDYRDFLRRIIAASTVVLCLIGPDWLTGTPQAPRSLRNKSDDVRLELASAFEAGVTVIPVMVGGADMPTARDLPKSLRKLASLHSIPLRGGRDFHRDVDDLVERLRSLGTSLKRPPRSGAPLPPPSPA